MYFEIDKYQQNRCSGKADSLEHCKAFLSMPSDISAFISSFSNLYSFLFI